MQEMKYLLLNIYYIQSNLCISSTTIHIILNTILTCNWKWWCYCNWL